MRTTKTSDDEISIIDDENGDEIELAKFEGIDRIEGRIEEFDRVKLSPSDLISIARWLLEKASDRAFDLEDRPDEIPPKKMGFEKECPPHEWDRGGETCLKCGQKDWM